MSDHEIKCPRCPGCDGPGKAVVGGWPPNPEQLFCHNAACNWLLWDGTQTLEENAAHPKRIELDPSYGVLVTRRAPEGATKDTLWCLARGHIPWLWHTWCPGCRVREWVGMWVVRRKERQP